MIPNKLHFKSLITGFILAVGVFFTMSFLIKSTEEIHAVANPEIILSEAISWNEAIAMRQKYVESQPLQIEIEDQSQPAGKKIVPLEGFSVEASHILEIIQNNKSSDGAQADNVVFFFGAKDPEPGMSLPAFHLIAVGERDGDLMIPSDLRLHNNAASSSVYDKANPCPPLCPSNE